MNRLALLVVVLVTGLLISTHYVLAQGDQEIDALRQRVSALFQQGKYQEAIPVAQQMVAACEITPDSNRTNTVLALGYLSAVYTMSGDYAKAEPLCKEALDRTEKTFGPDHPLTAGCLNNLAFLYCQTGDYAKAEQLWRRMLSIEEKALGPDHPDTANCLGSLGSLYTTMGDYAKAEPLCQRALKITEKALGPDHPYTARSLNNLAAIYELRGDHAKAAPLMERALKINEKALGPENPFTAASLFNLAETYSDLGDYAKAEPLLQRAVGIAEKTGDPKLTICLGCLGLISLDLGKKPAALELAEKEQQARLRALANVLSFASERQRLAYQMANGSTSTLFATLGSAPQIASAILRNKGVVLDSLLEDRLVAEASQNPEDRDLIEQLRIAKQGLAQLTLEVPNDFSQQAVQKRSAARDEAAQEVEQLEGTLGRHVAGLGRARRALSVTVEQVQTAIPSQTVLIELIFYSHYLGKSKLEDRCGAALLTYSGDPKWACLGAAADLVTNIQRYQELVRRKTDEAALTACLQTLYRQLWQPIEQVLPAGTRTIILSPDGDLNFVSFATLLTPDGQFLGQKYSLRYVTSGRDLLRETKPGADSKMVVYANPDFVGTRAVVAKSSSNDAGQTLAYQLPGPEQLALRSIERRDLQDLYLAPLPGTAKEGTALAAQAKKWNWPTEVYVEAAATETQLRSVRSPHILHLATHGFFLPETEAAGNAAGPGQRGIGGVSSFKPSSAIDLLAESERHSGQQVVLKNPMHRSGLALAGAQATLEAWKRGEVPPMENDGIVTAEEVGGLKLEGTWLVTLSACDTGTGEARSGEGVLGLRRGFIQAGAQNLLMTLWSVADEETAKLMVDFYSAAHESGNAPAALAKVQRNWLVRLRKERGLAAAVNIAGPFILSSQGSIK